MTFTKGHTLWNHPNCKKSQFKHGEARHSVPHSVEAKLKMSESRKGKTVGSANPSWKGGVTPLLIKLKRLTEYKTWQKGVFARDNYTCRSCSIRGCKTLTAHHLVSFSFIVQMLKVRSVDEAREQIMLWNIRNGVTLCEECHKQTANYAWRASKKPRDRMIYKTVMLALILLLPSVGQAATFGYTTIGASGSSHFSDTQDGGKYTLPDFAEITGISVYLNTTNSSYRVGMYDSSGTSLLIDAQAASSTGFTWNTTAVSYSASPDDYWVEALFDTTAIPTIVYDSVPGVNAHSYTQTYPTFRGTVSDNSDNRYSIYATYTTIPQTTLRINNGTIRINNGTLDL